MEFSFFSFWGVMGLDWAIFSTEEKRLRSCSRLGKDMSSTISTNLIIHLQAVAEPIKAIEPMQSQQRSERKMRKI